MRKVNFKKNLNKSYQKVQKSISHPIAIHLDKKNFLSTSLYHPKCINFTYFIRQEADVLMSHGVADKNYLSMKDTDGRMINKFEHIFVPGPWLKKKLLSLDGVKLSPEQIHVVGWPRLDVLLAQRKLYLKKSNVTEKKMNVLWAPTHDYRKRGAEKESTSSYPKFEEYTVEMSQKYHYTVALHPRNRKSKAATESSLSEADFVVSDFGTMVYEAWALGIPVIFPRWILKDRVIKYVKGSAEAYIFENNIGLHADSIEDVHRFISEGKPVGEDVKEFMQEYLPSEYLGQSGRLIAEKLSDINIKRSNVRIINFYLKLIKSKLGM
ncbi:CDP-glycerol glycerophosphotransferase family protein [Vibrio chagasii]|uniref:CDP-glycerol glycerophosphotransferase family protein n=1 Tax=Vibrio chagasii TaxID=170679 RepID=UPI003DA88DE0